MTATDRRAVVLGGTGLLGTAISRHLSRAGWHVVTVGRDPAHVAGGLAPGGAHFTQADRHDIEVLDALVDEHVELLVDCLCFTAADATSLLPLAARVRSTVMVSTKAVYVDALGNHSNSYEPPCFGGPVSEQQPTVEPGGGDYHSREGYAANKVAAEHVLLDSGHPVSVLRVSKAHGRGASRPREWVFVRRILDSRQTLVLANRGAGVDHPTAAANLAALVETVADKPGTRILNCADPDAPSGLEISRTIAKHLGYSWTEVLLDGNPQPPLGAYPWDAPTPIVLDMAAAHRLGYRPIGSYADTVVEEVDWLVERAHTFGIDTVINQDEASFFAHFLDYEIEDRFLATHPPVA